MGTDFKGKIALVGRYTVTFRLPKHLAKTFDFNKGDEYEGQVLQDKQGPYIVIRVKKK